MANGNRISGLLGDPRLLIGAGLLSGQSFPQAAAFASQQQQATSDRERQALQNQAMRQAMTQRQRQREALQQLPGLLQDTSVVQGAGRQVEGLGGETIGNIPGRQSIVPRTQTTEGRADLVGLLGEIAPQTAAQGLLSEAFPQQQRAEPAPVRIARVLADPNESEEVKDNLRRQIAAQGTEADLERVRLLTQQAQLARLQREENLAQRSVEQQQRALRVNSGRTFNSVRKVVNLTNKLEETGVSLQPGNPFAPQLRQALAFGAPFARAVGFGGSADEWDEAVATFDELDKELNALQLEVAALSGSRQPTNFMLQSVQKSTANIGIAPEAIRSVVPGIVQGLIDAAEIEGIEFDELQDMQAFIDEIEGRGETTRESEPVIDVPGLGARAADIAKMNMEQIRNLDVESMSQQQLQAIDRRLKELGL